MKILIFLLILSPMSFATEVQTDCPAMNQSREKIVKEKTSGKKKSGSQVSSQ